MRLFNGVSEFREAVGTHLGYSEWHTISQRQIDTFADATGDHQWIHVDPAKASTSSFGSTIAHGFLTLSLVPKLTWQIYKVNGLQMEINYGANSLRFPAPVPVGSQVRAGIELLSVEPCGNACYQAVSRVTIERQERDKPACVVESISLLVP
ncbi:MaoC family dehydratase [Mycobacterium aquaticum]|uniref:Dehydratase n=1 Tax=Mycobacterium aquaticum TaxID=1927124 RepID=A0A1W9ZV24_9MYCO|nr:MaoC family dehydratase [Mycobacterium aquaticum]ORA21488.1 dehydratase [Mycobacterium aquaticum]